MTRIHNILPSYLIVESKGKRFINLGILLYKAAVPNESDFIYLQHQLTPSSSQSLNEIPIASRNCMQTKTICCHLCQKNSMQLWRKSLLLLNKENVWKSITSVFLILFCIFIFKLPSWLSTSDTFRYTAQPLLSAAVGHRFNFQIKEIQIHL